MNVVRKNNNKGVTGSTKILANTATNIFADFPTYTLCIMRINE